MDAVPPGLPQAGGLGAAGPRVSRAPVGLFPSGVADAQHRIASAEEPHRKRRGSSLRLVRSNLS